MKARAAAEFEQLRDGTCFPFFLSFQRLGSIGLICLGVDIFFAFNTPPLLERAFVHISKPYDLDLGLGIFYISWYGFRCVGSGFGG